MGVMSATQAKGSLFVTNVAKQDLCAANVLIDHVLVVLHTSIVRCVPTSDVLRNPGHALVYLRLLYVMCVTLDRTHAHAASHCQESCCAATAFVFTHC